MGLAAAHGVKSIAFPAISTGVFGFPLAQASRVAVETIATFLTAQPAFENVRLVAFRDENALVLRRAVDAVGAVGAAKSPR
jgi:O-acetyl-ADP-ribose deacetylase (regulator of RNase III)